MLVNFFLRIVQRVDAAIAVSRGTFRCGVSVVNAEEDIHDAFATQGKKLRHRAIVLSTGHWRTQFDSCIPSN